VLGRALNWVRSRNLWQVGIFLLAGALSLLGWLLFFSRAYFPDEWEKPLLAIAAILISLKLGGFILASVAALVVKSYRWLRAD
jgi:hypothetical protein